MTITKSNQLTPPATPLAVPNPEVQPSTSRANWTAAKKLAILTEYESFVRGAPERGALLRRHGIYTSHISKWRDQRNRGALAALTPQPRGPKPTTPDPLAVENARLHRDIARLQARLEQAAIVIDIQKKVAQLLGVTLPSDSASDL